MLRILSLFGPFAAVKFWVAVLMAVQTFVNTYFQFDIGMDQQTLTVVLNGVGAFLVWALPNKKPTVDPKTVFPEAPKGLW